MALAGSSVLLCMGILMVFGVYIEGLPALFAWLLVGLGLGALQPARS